MPVTTTTSGGQSPVRPKLEPIAAQLESDLSHGHADRARAQAALAATIMTTQGQHAPADEIPWLMTFGEGFFRWKLPAEGVLYWTALFQLLQARGKGLDSVEGQATLANVGAYRVLAGELTSSAPIAYSTLSVVKKVFGEDHAMTREVVAKLGPVAPPPAASPGPPPPNLAPPASKPVSASANLDGITALALWVTLAFLDIAMADGNIDDSEHEAWKKAMKRLELPDVWERYGLEGLTAMLDKGMLQELSMEFATLPDAVREKMVEALVEFMMADGKIDPREVESIKKITGWLGVQVELE
jgi:uncharacterized tellurite resistance protein B-like protein